MLNKVASKQVPTLGTTLGYVPYGTGRFSPFDQVFTKGHAVHPDSPESFNDVDAIVVWGGEDISPSIYKDKVGSHTYADEELSYRDKIEVQAMQIAIARGIPIIGVCRGAQLACAIAGGKLVQHVDNHGRSHKITTDEGRSITTSSVHHQMMYPWDIDHKLIAWSSEKRSEVHLDGSDQQMEMETEPEIVFFPTIKALAIQGHPEFMDESSEFVQYCNTLVQSYLLEK